VAEDYDRYRLGPIGEVADWVLGDVTATATTGATGRVVDVGAGTGAMARLLVDRARQVMAVEPDARMRTVLAANVPGATVLEGRGEAIPLEDASADAVVVSSAWHWMDPGPTTAEVARVLRPGGVLGVVWSGLDWQASGFGDLRSFVRGQRADTEGAGSLGEVIDTELPEDRRHAVVLPDGAPFAAAQSTDIRWSVALDAQQLLGMLGTFSGVITLPDDQRRTVLAEAERLLADDTNLAAGGTEELPYRARCWRAVRD
jgi:SAM-dependent methyltransferase